MNKKRFLFPVVAASVLALSSCGENKSAEKLGSGIYVNNMDTTVSPGDNFMQFVNGSWIKNTKIPSDKPSFGAASILNEKAQEDVRAIIENAAKSEAKAGSEEQKIGDYYASYLNQKGRDSIGLAPLQEEFKKIDAITSTKDLAAYFARANKLGFSVPFSLSMSEDFKDPKQYMLSTWQSGLGLPEREYYFLKDAKSVEIRTKYLAHLENILGLAGIADAKPKAAKIMALETALASKHMKKEDTRNIVGLYNKYGVNKLNTLMPDFDWKTMLDEAGVGKADSLVVTQVQYTKDLNSIIKNTPLEDWKTYLKWGAINGSATLLTTALDREHFNFYNKTLYGVEEQMPQWRRAVNSVNGALGEMVGKLYVEKHFPPEAKERMLALVDNLLPG